MRTCSNVGRSKIGDCNDPACGNPDGFPNLDCQVFFDSCFQKQFAIIVYALDMLGDGLF